MSKTISKKCKNCNTSTLSDISPDSAQCVSCYIIDRCKNYCQECYKNKIDPSTGQHSSSNNANIHNSDYASPQLIAINGHLDILIFHRVHYV